MWGYGMSEWHILRDSFYYCTFGELIRLRVGGTSVHHPVFSVESFAWTAGKFKFTS